MPNITINIDMDRLCPECGKGGACENGLCLSCTTKAMDPARRMKSVAGREVQKRWKLISARGVQVKK